MHVIKICKHFLAFRVEGISILLKNKVNLEIGQFTKIVVCVTVSVCVSGSNNFFVIKEINPIQNLKLNWQDLQLYLGIRC